MVEKISKRSINVLGLDLVRAVKKMPEVVETWVQWAERQKGYSQARQGTSHYRRPWNSSSILAETVTSELLLRATLLLLDTVRFPSLVSLSTHLDE